MGFDSRRLSDEDAEAAALIDRMLEDLDVRFYRSLENDGTTWHLALQHLRRVHPGLSNEAAETVVRSISYAYK